MVQTRDGDVEVVTYELLSQVPACNRDRTNLVYYVKSENRFFYCDGRKLSPIDLSCPPDKTIKTLIATTDAPPDQCPTGGVLIQIGLDANSNDKLDPSEVKSSARVCNGATGPQVQRGPKVQKGLKAPKVLADRRGRTQEPASSSITATEPARSRARTAEA